MTTRDVRFPKNSGKFPERLLEYIKTSVSFDKDTNAIGTSPTSILLPSLRDSRFMQPEMLAGIWPENELFSRPKNLSLYKLPISRGISPMKPLFWMSNIWRKLRFPIKGDSEPTSFSDGSIKWVTLGCRWPHVIPCHWQKWTESFHMMKTPKGE